MTSDGFHPKKPVIILGGQLSTTDAEYLNKTIILSIYTNLPHTQMQNVVFLNKLYGVAVLLLQWKETDKKQCALDSFTNKTQCIHIIVKLKYFLIFF